MLAKQKDQLMLSSSLAALLLICFMQLGRYLQPDAETIQPSTPELETHTARVVANGDLLYHDSLYTSALYQYGSYQLEHHYEYVKEWISGADLAIGDFEGTINPELPPNGYPLFNAPIEAAQAIQRTGYDVVDLAHNHILDTGLSGALSTHQIFSDLGVTPVGLYPNDRSTDGLVIKEVNGIKIAILGYAYGFNGMEGNLSEEEYTRHLSDLDETKMQVEIERAEQEADVTIIMPQMGVEEALEPSEEQVTLYHKMIDWGADVVFGGHPHVPQPSETLEKDGEKKFIIYSMGNFLSDQRLETLGNIWTERGVLMDVTFEKTGEQTLVKTVTAHPTMLWATGLGAYGSEGYEYADYRVIVLQDFIEGGRYRDLLDDAMKARVDTAYQEINGLVNVTW